MFDSENSVTITDESGKCASVLKSAIAAIESTSEKTCTIHLAGGSSINLNCAYSEAVTALTAN